MQRAIKLSLAESSARQQGHRIFFEFEVTTSFLGLKSVPAEPARNSLHQFERRSDAFPATHIRNADSEARDLRAAMEASRRASEVPRSSRYDVGREERDLREALERSVQVHHDMH